MKRKPQATYTPDIIEEQRRMAFTRRLGLLQVCIGALGLVTLVVAAMAGWV